MADDADIAGDIERECLDVLILNRDRHPLAGGWTLLQLRR